MTEHKKSFPAFKYIYVCVSILFILISCSIFLKGIQASMQDFAVPLSILGSLHYQDAMVWVYSHMLIIGLIIGLMGLMLKEPPLRLWMSRLLFLANAYYTYMDFRSSDSVIGNGLYQGPASLAPAFISLFVTLLFLYLSLSKKACGFDVGVEDTTKAA